MLTLFCDLLLLLCLFSSSNQAPLSLVTLGVDLVTAPAYCTTTAIHFLDPPKQSGVDETLGSTWN